MNKHDNYMADFMKVFEALERWGPGDEKETLKAFRLLPSTPHHILEIGYGKGLATELLAQNSNAQITAVDNEEAALTQMNERLQATSYIKRIHSVCASMTELPFDHACFDLIWAEGSAYMMGVTSALE